MRGLILFDIDGTILRTGDITHQRAFVIALREVFAVDASLDGIPLSGMLDSQIARLALHNARVSDDEIDAGLAEMMTVMGQRYREMMETEERRSWLLPGVVDLMSSLRAGGFALGVLSGNATPVGRAKLEKAGVADFFPFGAFGDSARERGGLVPDALERAHVAYEVEFSAQQTMLIGDTPRDIEAARDADTGILSVATGRFSLETLEQHNPDILMPDLGDAQHALIRIADWLSSR